MNAALDAVFHPRMLRSMGMPIEEAPDPTCQRQLARLLLLPGFVALKSRRVLEFGCAQAKIVILLLRR
jgi:hypothetical protein